MKRISPLFIYVSLFKISHLNKIFEMQSMHLNIAGLQNFSAFLSAAAAGYLLFMFLGKCGVKLLHVKIFMFYKVFFKACTTMATFASMG